MAKKLKLDVDELAVDSFSSSDDPQERGTVQGHTAYMWCQHTYNQYDIQCYSVDGNCGETQYYNYTCDPSGPRPCSCPGE